MSSSVLALLVCSANACLQLPATTATQGRRAAIGSASAAAVSLVPQLAAAAEAKAGGSTMLSRVMQPPPSEKLYCLNVILRVKAERREEFLKCIVNNQVGTLTKEPLAVEYTYGEDETTPNTFHFHEKYRGRAGFEAHTKAPHFAVYESFARGRASSDPFTAPPEVVFYQAEPLQST